MNFIQKIIGKVKIIREYTKFRELGNYQSIFTPFGREIYMSDLVRDCVRPLSEQTSRANPRSTDKRIERMLTYRPNPFMNGKDFLAKCRNILEVKNTLFVLINRDERGRCIGLYPVPYSSFEAVEYNNGLYIKFYFTGDQKELVAPWADLAVCRKDYIFSDIGGENNNALLQPLEILNTTNQGVANAVKATSNLRGILKNTKSMIDTDDTKASRDKFVKDYMQLENSGGIAALDPTQEFTPINLSPTVASFGQLKEFRENVYRYFGVSEEIVQSKATPDQMQAFYEARIEPFLIAFSLELTGKIFTERELGFGAQIIFESSKLQFASLDKKISLFATVVSYGGMTINEWRASLNLAPIEGGDVPIRRLDAAPIAAPANTEEEENND